MFLSMMVLASTFIKTRNPPPIQKRALFRLQDFKDVHYVICCLSFFVGYLGLYVFYYYIQLYAIDVAHTDSKLAFYLLTILNTGSSFGRLLPAYAAGVFGPMNVQIVFGVLTGILSFCLLAIKSTPGVIVFSALYGFISGPFASLPIVIINGVTSDKSLIATRFGITCAFIGLAVLIGEPVAGAHTRTRA
jgi:predicted MFS family arabinose efflux permease